MNRWLQFLQGELAPFPGRMNVALRTIASAAIVIVASMTLQVPYLAVSAIVVFYVTQSNVVLTRMLAFLFLAGTTLAVGCAILLLKFTFDYPLLRIALASLIFFCCVYAMRIFQFGIVFFVAALVTIYVQSFVDVTQNAEGIVRATLWVWVACCYPIALALIVNTLLLPAEPREQLRRLMVSKLSDVQAKLSAVLDSAMEPQPITAFDVQAVTTSLQKLLRFTAMRGGRDEIAKARDLATVTAVSNLYVAASNLRRPPAVSGALATGIASAREQCKALSDTIRSDQPFSVPEKEEPAAPAAPSTPTAGMPWPLVTMSHALEELAAFAAAQTSSMHQTPKQPAMVADAWSNPVYAQFALKTLLAVLVCYVFYNAAQWQGVHTVMLTCLVVAQPSLGASSRRSLLRLVGAVVGSLLALAEIIFILPRIDGIASLLVCVLPVFFAGAWVAAGSERISYAGVQIMFTFSLAFLEQFAPAFDLTEIRDRIVGIFLGIVVATFVQMSLWPEGEAALLRRRLSACLMSTAKLLVVGSSAAGDARSTIAAERMAAWAALGDCEGLLLRVALEPTWREGEEERIALRANSVLAAARELLVAADALRNAFAAAERHIPVPVDTAVRNFAAQAASAVTEYVSGLSGRTPAAKAPRLPAGGVQIDRSALTGDAGSYSAELAVEADRVWQAVSSLPDWIGDADSFALALPAGAHHE